MLSSLRPKLIGYFQLMRPAAVVIMGFATFVGQVIALKGVPSLGVSIFPVLASALVTSSSFAVNDYFDYNIDRVNKPGKPIPSGVVPRDRALVFGAALFLAGFSASLAANLSATLLLLITYGLSLLYNGYAKKTGLLGNIIVSFSVSMAFVYGSLTAVNSADPVVLFVAFLSFFINLGREVVQSIQDMEGDRVEGVRSVALVKGPRVAAALGSAFSAVSLTTAPIVLFFTSDVATPSFLLIILAEAGFIASCILLLRKPTKQAASKFIKQVNIWTVIILTAFLLNTGF